MRKQINARITTASTAAWSVIRFLEHQRDIGANGTFPALVARHLGITRLEAELALRLLVEWNNATRRGDGRYFWHDPRTVHLEATA